MTRRTAKILGLLAFGKDSRRRPLFTMESVMLYARNVLLVALLLPTAIWAQEKDPGALLSQALRRGDLYNWSDAEPLLAGAERLYSQRGDARNALYARLGHIRSTMEQLSLQKHRQCSMTSSKETPF